METDRMKLIQYISEKTAPCRTSFREWADRLDAQVCRYEYASGGVLLPHGYYCPSPVYDIIITNIKRGKLLQRHPRKDPPDYCYGFNKDDELITACKEGVSKELFVRDGQDVFGVMGTMRDWDIPNFMTFARYEGGRIQAFAYIDYMLGRFGSCWLEEYEYQNGLLETAILDHFRRDTTLFKCVYHFEHDSDGYLSSYSGQELIHQDCEVPPYQPHTYPIKVRRKV